MFRSIHKGPWRQSADYFLPHAWILQYVKALMAGFMRLDRKLFAGHRQTLSSRCVIPSCTYLLYFAVYIVSKLHRVAISGRISCAKKEESSRASRVEAHKTAERLFSSPRLPFAIAKTARDGPLRRAILLPPVCEAISASSSSRETLKPDSK